MTPRFMRSMSKGANRLTPDVSPSIMTTPRLRRGEAAIVGDGENRVRQDVGGESIMVERSTAARRMRELMALTLFRRRATGMCIAVRSACAPALARARGGGGLPVD